MTLRPDPREPDPRESKLPGWARETINRLRRQVTDAEAAATAARLATDPEGSDAFIDDRMTGDAPPVGLGRETVTFRTGPRDAAPRWDHTIAVRRHRDGHLVVSANSGRLAVWPSASNSVQLTIEP